MDSLVEAREDVDEIGGALATEIIPDSNIFDQGSYFAFGLNLVSERFFKNWKTNWKTFSNRKKKTI